MPFDANGNYRTSGEALTGGRGSFYGEFGVMGSPVGGAARPTQTLMGNAQTPTAQSGPSPITAAAVAGARAPQPAAAAAAPGSGGVGVAPGARQPWQNPIVGASLSPGAPAGGSGPAGSPSYTGTAPPVYYPQPPAAGTPAPPATPPPSESPGADKPLPPGGAQVPDTPPAPGYEWYYNSPNNPGWDPSLPAGWHQRPSSGGGTGGGDSGGGAPRTGSGSRQALPSGARPADISKILGDPTKAFGLGQAPTVGMLAAGVPYQPFAVESGYGQGISANPIGSRQGRRDPYAELIASARFGRTPEDVIREASQQGRNPLMRVGR